MTLDRRKLFKLAAGAAAAISFPPPVRDQSNTKSHYKAIAFDAFTILDPRPIFGLAETLFPGRGAELSGAWRTRQFEYQWLRSLTGHYADFWQTTEEGLMFAAATLKLDLTPEKRERLMDGYLKLKAWPDAPPALASLKETGLRLSFLSNMTTKMLNTNIRNAGLDGIFDLVLSADQIRTHKPDPRAYQMAATALRARKEEILFAAFAGWDAAGAKWFGYPTFWVNRLNAPTEELGVTADATGRDLSDLLRFVKESY